MSTQAEMTQRTWAELEECISKAMAKVKTEKETDLCQFLPGDDGRFSSFRIWKIEEKKPKNALRYD